MPTPDLLLTINLVATCFMTGLIWFVQVIHYPLMSDVAPDRFCAFHRRHRDRTTAVVAPAMLIEGATAVALLIFRPAALPAWSAGLGVALLAIAWASTAWLQVPCHHRLGQAFDPAVHQSLCKTNWIRTAAWSARAILMAAALISG